MDLAEGLEMGMPFLCLHQLDPLLPLWVRKPALYASDRIAGRKALCFDSPLIYSEEDDDVASKEQS